MNLKQIDYEYRPINLRKFEHLEPEYKAEVSAARQVPVLHIDGLKLSESMAVCEYLEETRPDLPFLPSAAGERAQVRRLC